MQQDLSGHYAPHQPAVAWGAIWAGAFAAVATSFALTLAAAGLGYTFSPGLSSRASIDGFSPTVGVGLIVIQVLSAGLGGYLAGRLRTLWHSVHGHESHFRDTAHGLIVWAVATVAGVVLTATVLGPYADAMHPVVAAAAASATPADAERAAGVAAQSALFMAVGLFTSAFFAAVAARLGGMETEAAHARMHGAAV